MSSRLPAASAPVFLALGCVGFLSSPALASDPVAPVSTDAQSGVSQRTDEAIVVTGTRDQRELESPKATSDLLDTPQTVTVISDQTLRRQNLLTLRDALSTIPGITFGAGEGGGGFGDSINLRGYSANSDITVDGVRDSAQYTRSDPFNVEQIEVINGANSVYSGAGSVGGSINIVTKQPGGRDTATFTGAGGTHGYGRAMLDANHVFGEQLAGRLNAMVHGNDVAGRDVEHFKRWGVAPSLTYGINGATQITAGVFYQHDDNIPQYGLPFAMNNYNFGLLQGVDREGYYGFRNTDTQQIDVAAFTLQAAHRFSDNLRFRNLARYQVVDQFTLVTQPQGTFCLPNGTFAAPASNAAVNCAPADTFLRNVSGTTRDTRNTNLYDQADLTGIFVTGALEHSFNLGVSLLSETFHLDNGSSFRFANGASPAASVLTTSITHPDSLYTGPVNFIQAGAQDGERRNQAIYAFDTVRLSPRWEINAGLRYEHNEGSNRTDTYNTTVGAAAFGQMTPGVTNRNSENLLSYRAGLVFKPIPEVSLYAAYGNSTTPSQAAVNGGCTQTTPPPATGNTCNVDPEQAINYEVGGKWDAFGGKLLLTAALFRNERSNYKVASNEPGIPDQVLDGRSRVDGLSLGASGRITDKWAVFANYTHLESEVVRGKSKFCLANPAASGCPAPDVDPTGRELTNTPNDSGSLWTTYDLPHRLQVGYGLTRQGSYLLSNTLTPRDPVTNAVKPLFRSDSYVVHRLMVSYEVSEHAALQLNVNNVTDAFYLQRIRNSAQSWATPGDARNAVLTLNYRF
jgi:catecholate siderophore receptor